MYQQVTIIGHLGADPEMRYTANGSAVTNFRVATSRSWSDQSGEKREETEWFRIVAWNRLAEICAQYLVKGRLVFVQGRLQTRSWEDQQGQKRYTTELFAQEVKFLGGASGSGGSGGFSTPGFAAAPSGADLVGGGDIDPDDLPF